MCWTTGADYGIQDNTYDTLGFQATGLRYRKGQREVTVALYQGGRCVEKAYGAVQEAVLRVKKFVVRDQDPFLFRYGNPPPQPLGKRIVICPSKLGGQTRS